jgi:hypothetical protein
MCRVNNYKATQTHHRAVIGNYIMDKHKIKLRINYRNTIMQKKQEKQVKSSQVKSIMRPTVSQPVCFGVGPPFGAHDHILHVL